MSATYRAISWTPFKRRYDAAIAAGVIVYLAVFVSAGLAVHPSATIETILIRALGSLAFVLLTVILSIGPACRLDVRWLPLLYNRRHLGVTTFLVALAHGAFATVQFHALGDVSPLVSLLGGDPGFQTMGLMALAILFVMAATSHDFWLATLSAPIWKSLHVGVYAAYALVVAHVAFGALRSEVHPILAIGTGLDVLWIAGLHLAAGWKERADDAERPRTPADWIDAGPALEIPDGRARIVCAAGERIAVFRYGNKVAAVSNLCQHQNGPLGEGRVLDGCITCPWHGYQYLPESGRSPEPFTERIPTFDTRLIDGRVFVNPHAHPPGTPVPPSMIHG
ncbi:MAG TPA: Rieske 2Fe-2S domain-containing protein [Candidatus Polarisedimenticolaceae bacterium]|nr:Rieske 2Fe-2S domain-containing protein [Candidatus Polarisedimenticolaceae bacterium]